MMTQGLSVVETMLTSVLRCSMLDQDHERPSTTPSSQSGLLVCLPTSWLVTLILSRRGLLTSEGTVLIRCPYSIAHIASTQTSASLFLGPSLPW